REERPGSPEIAVAPAVPDRASALQGDERRDERAVHQVLDERHQYERQYELFERERLGDADGAARDAAVRGEREVEGLPRGEGRQGHARGRGYPTRRAVRRAE